MNAASLRLGMGIHYRDTAAVQTGNRCVPSLIQNRTLAATSIRIKEPSGKIALAYVSQEDSPAYLSSARETSLAGVAS